MAPPTVANGKVYLASFGTQNVGTGQLCVYGLLPSTSGARISAPTGVTVMRVSPLTVRVSWRPVEGAMFYRVRRSNAHAPNAKTFATGLTSPNFIDGAPDKGDPATYMVVAVGRNGASIASQAVTFGGPVNKKRSDED